MDNWDYKFEHPVIVRSGQTRLTHISGVAQATAATPDTIKSSSDLGNSSFTAAGDQYATYSNVSKVVLKLAAPCRVKNDIPYFVNLSNATPSSDNGEIYYSPAAYFIRGHTLSLKLEEIVAPFDLDVDTSWNGLGGLSLGASIVTAQASVDGGIGELIGHQRLFMPSVMTVYRTPSAQGTIYGFVVSTQMSVYLTGIPGTISSITTELVFGRPETHYQFLGQPAEL